MANGIVVEVRTDDTRVKEGTSARTGKPYHIVEQVAYAHLPGQPYPQRCVIGVPDNEQPYQAGLYTLSSDSYFVGRFEQLMFRPRLDRESRRELPQSAGGPSRVKEASNG